MIVNVTHKHIEDSNNATYWESERSHCCPVALALNEATGGSWVVAPTKCWRYYTSSVFALPQEVTLAIHRYDGFGVMEPFSFELEIAP